jgi:hypothetical protein
MRMLEHLSRDDECDTKTRRLISEKSETRCFAQDFVPRKRGIQYEDHKGEEHKVGSDRRLIVSYHCRQDT